MTEEQAENLIAQVDRLEAMQFTLKDGVPVPVFQGEPPGQSLGWGDLTTAQKESALAMQVNWEGIPPGQELAAIQDIAAGKPPSEWIEDIEMDAALIEAAYQAMERDYDEKFARESAETRAIFAEWTEDYALRSMPEPHDNPVEIRKPPNHGTYQVWRDGNHTFDVESVAVHKIEELTGRADWQIDPSVTFHGDDRRPLLIGDVVVDPTCGAWEIQEDGYLSVKPPASVIERMEREGIVPQHLVLLQDWTRDHLQDMDDRLRPEPPSPLDQVMEAIGNPNLPDSLRAMEEEYHRNISAKEPKSAYKQQLDEAASNGKYVSRGEEIER